MEEFVTKLVLIILDLSRTTLQDWKSRGFISPTARSEGIQGKEVWYTIEDILLIRIFQILKNSLGANRSKLFHIISHLTNQKIPWVFEDDMGSEIKRYPTKFDDIGPEDWQCKFFIYFAYEDGVDWDKNPTGFYTRIPKDISRGRSQFALIMNLVEIKRDIEARIKKATGDNR